MMDIDTIVRAVLLIVLMFAFVGMFLWSWSKDRKTDFEFMEKLPLDETAKQEMKEAADAK